MDTQSGWCGVDYEVFRTELEYDEHTFSNMWGEYWDEPGVDERDSAHQSPLHSINEYSLHCTSLSLHGYILLRWTLLAGAAPVKSI
jgi:hypothetical protein